MRQMKSLAISLLALLTVAEASRLQEEKERLLKEAEEFGKGPEHDHGRELWWWLTSDDQQEGERCGERNTCAEGLECTPVAMGNRCTAQTLCLADGFQKLGEEVDPEELKQQLYWRTWPMLRMTVILVLVSRRLFRVKLKEKMVIRARIS